VQDLLFFPLALACLKQGGYTMAFSFLPEDQQARVGFDASDTSSTPFFRQSDSLFGDNISDEYDTQYEDIHTHKVVDKDVEKRKRTPRRRNVGGGGTVPTFSRQPLFSAPEPTPPFSQNRQPLFQSPDFTAEKALSNVPVEEQQVPVQLSSPSSPNTIVIEPIKKAPWFRDPARIKKIVFGVVVILLILAVISGVATWIDTRRKKKKAAATAGEGASQTPSDGEGGVKSPPMKPISPIVEPPMISAPTQINATRVMATLDAPERRVSFVDANGDTVVDNDINVNDESFLLAKDYFKNTDANFGKQVHHLNARKTSELFGVDESDGALVVSESGKRLIRSLKPADSGEETRDSSLVLLIIRKSCDESMEASENFGKAASIVYERCARDDSLTKLKFATLNADDMPEFLKQYVENVPVILNYNSESESDEVEVLRSVEMSELLDVHNRINNEE
jgi:hypothetical protein